MATLPPLTKKSDHDALGARVGVVETALPDKANQSALDDLAQTVGELPTTGDMAVIAENVANGAELLVPAASGPVVWDIEANEVLVIDAAGDGVISVANLGARRGGIIDFLETATPTTWTFSADFAPAGFEVVTGAGAQTVSFLYTVASGVMKVVGAGEAEAERLYDGVNEITAADAVQMQTDMAHLRVAVLGPSAPGVDALLALAASYGLSEGDGTGMTYSRSDDAPTGLLTHFQNVYV